MISPKDRQERGQAIVLMAFALVAMLGFAAVALDGGNLYTEQRRAQSAADMAVLAAAYKQMEGTTSTSALQTVARANAALNDFDNNGTTNWVTLNQPPTSGAYRGKAGYLEVVITERIPTALAHLVYKGPLQVTTRAVAYGFYRMNWITGNAIVGMGNCVSGGGHLLESTGGGHAGGVATYNGGMFVNAPENAGNHCAIDPPNNGIGIYAQTGYTITTVGSYNYAGTSNLGPLPIVTGFNGGAPITDPLANVDEPTCTRNGSSSGNNPKLYQPGNYGGVGQPSLGAGTMAPGIYCITGDVRFSGQESIEGDGVVIVMKTGSLSFSGQSTLRITAPTSENCLGTYPSTSASCTYLGMAFWASRTNSNTVIDAGGNGAIDITGTLYALNGTVNAHGNGSKSQPYDAAVTGQVIAARAQGNGNGAFKVNYEAGFTFTPPPIIQLLE
jgi:hypothetical protein